MAYDMAELNGQRGDIFMEPLLDDCIQVDATRSQRQANKDRLQNVEIQLRQLTD